MQYGDAIWLAIKSNLDLKWFVLDQGDDIFSPFMTFPQLPDTINLDGGAIYQDIRITKTEKITTDNDVCNAAQEYKYAGKFMGRVCVAN